MPNLCPQVLKWHPQRHNRHRKQKKHKNTAKDSTRQPRWTALPEKRDLMSTTWPANPSKSQVAQSFCLLLTSSHSSSPSCHWTQTVFRLLSHSPARSYHSLNIWFASTRLGKLTTFFMGTCRSNSNIISSAGSQLRTSLSPTNRASPSHGQMKAFLAACPTSRGCRWLPLVETIHQWL